MALLSDPLDLERCPHCKVDRPSLWRRWVDRIADYRGTYTGVWAAFVCARCGKAVLVQANDHTDEILAIYPQPAEFDESIPERARHYLREASNSAPSGAVMVAASAIDAMLKAKGYKDDSLYQRIDKAATDHLITDEMRLWAHEVRLDANDQRHADESAPFATADDARRCIDFAVALGQFLFVLPSRVRRGREDAKGVIDTATLRASEAVQVNKNPRSQSATG